MTNEKINLRRSDTKVIVPVTDPTNQSHVIKYFILSEEPKGFICEKGCVHEYPSKFQKSYPVPPLAHKQHTYPPKKTDKAEKLRHTESPLAFKYLPPGKTIVSILEKNSSLISSITSPCSTTTSGNALSRISRLTELKSSSTSSPKSVSSPSPTKSSSGNMKRQIEFNKTKIVTPPKIVTQELPTKPLVQDMTQTYFPSAQGMKLIGAPGSFIRNTARRFLDRTNPGDLTVEYQEKEYDKNSDVFSRLYPYVPKPKKVQEEENKLKMDWLNYHRLDVIYEFMDDLERLFPSLCTVGVIGHSIEGRDIKLLKISNGNANNVAVWIDAGIHAREWIGPAVNTYIANYIARNFDKLPINCTNKDWYFLPVANPDGYEYSHTKNRMWRKNRAWQGGKCVGVDINRNFSVAWGGRGSSSDPNNCFYRGTSPFSEPESCAFRDVLLDSKLPFKVYITLHAFGEVIIFPLAHSDSLCPDYIRLLHGATVMSRAIYNTNGTTYRVGVSKDVMYRASGTSNDWCYSAVGIPYCYLIELRSKKHKFKLPETEIKESGEEILNCVIALMKFVDTYPLEQNSGDHRREPAKKAMINIWKEELSTMDVMVEGSRLEQLSSLLNEREIPYTVAISDVGAMVAAERGAIISKTKSRTFHAGSMDWTSYHRLGTIYSFMENLSREYPYLVTLHTIGQTVEGRNIVMMKVSNGKAGNSGVWIDGAIHPREWISAAVVTYFANALVRTFHDMPSSVTNKDWYLLPVLNPDGYEYTHTHDRMWRKNRAHYGECIGVDLNRNFSYGWGENGEEGSSNDPGNIFYRGPQPFSEPETAAVRNAVLAADVPFKAFLSFHSYGEVIIFPWGYSTEACPDYVELLEGGTAMAKAIFETSGRVYKVGSTKDLMYYAAGTSIDWSYGTVNIPFSYMIELRGKKHRFLLPKDEILSTAQEVWNGVLRLMDFIDHRCRSTQHCVCRK